MLLIHNNLHLAAMNDILDHTSRMSYCLCLYLHTYYHHASSVLSSFLLVYFLCSCIHLFRSPVLCFLLTLFYHKQKQTRKLQSGILSYSNHRDALFPTLTHCIHRGKLAPISGAMTSEVGGA